MCANTDNRLRHNYVSHVFLRIYRGSYYSNRANISIVGTSIYTDAVYRTRTHAPTDEERGILFWFRELLSFVTIDASNSARTNDSFEPYSRILQLINDGEEWRLTPMRDL
jgi:hypothetical protein